MNAHQRINRLTNWQIAVFVVPIILQVIRFVSPSSKGLEGQLTWKLVRFGITVLALVVVGVLELQKRKLRKEPIS